MHVESARAPSLDDVPSCLCIRTGTRRYEKSPYVTSMLREISLDSCPWRGQLSVRGELRIPEAGQAADLLRGAAPSGLSSEQGHQEGGARQ